MIRAASFRTEMRDPLVSSLLGVRGARFFLVDAAFRLAVWIVLRYLCAQILGITLGCSDTHQWPMT